MSNRTLVELNHDFCPGRSTQALAEWAAKIAAYMRSGDKAELPYGVTFKYIRHHSAPDDPTVCMRQQIDNLKVALRVNFLRWNPSLSHEQITDEIERIVGEVTP